MLNTAINEEVERSYFLAGETIACGSEEMVYRPQGMRFWVLHLTVKGRGVIKGEGLSGPGDLFLFPPGVPHHYWRDPEGPFWQHLWITFSPRPDWEEAMNWPRLPKGSRKIHLPTQSDNDEIKALFEEIIAHSRSTLPSSYALCMNRLEYLFIRLSEVTWQSSAWDGRIQKLTAFILPRLSEEWSIGRMAEQAGLSPSRFAHLFKDETSLSPGMWLQKVRLNRAQELLISTSLRIGEVAARCGYQDPLHFSHVFKKVFQTSPSEYRKGRFDAYA